jgi:hypothetical protein
MNELPENEKDLKNWLYKLFCDKDKRLTNYYNNNKTITEIHNCEPGIPHRTKPWLTIPPVFICSIFLLPYILLSFGIQLYLKVFCVTLFCSFTHLIIYFTLYSV